MPEHVGGMPIEWGEVQPNDLVRLNVGTVDEPVIAEARIARYGDVERYEVGHRLLRADSSPDDFEWLLHAPGTVVELLQRGIGDADEPKRNPTGWQTPRGWEAHYFREGKSLCGDVWGYVGVCYRDRPVAGVYFLPGITTCARCEAALEALG